MTINNARIYNTVLGFNADGFFEVSINFQGDIWEGSLVDFKAYHKEPLPSLEKIAELFLTVGVHKWEELQNQYIRVKAEDGKITAIGNIIEDKWFSFKDYQ